MNHEHHIFNDTRVQKSVDYYTNSGQVNRVRTGSLLEGIFFICTLAALLIWREAPSFRTLAITFAAIVLEAFPFMLIGSLTGGFIETFISREQISRLVPEGKRGVFLAGGLGIIFPVCECAIVPVIRRLLGKSMSPGAAVAFLLAGPIVNPIVFLSTGTAYSFQWSISFVRLVSAYAISVSIGLFLQWSFGAGFRNKMLRENYTPKDEIRFCVCKSEHKHVLNQNLSKVGIHSRIWDAIVHGTEDFLDTGRFLVIGAFVAALIQTLLPQEILATVAGSSVISIVTAIGMAIGLNLCSEADAFVAASMRSMWPFAGQIAFMLLGPMLDIKLLFMYRSVFRGRFVLVLTTTVVALVFLTALGIHFCSIG